ncbi:MAG: diaminopimelate epimerase [Propioniciclava sp.]
MVRFTKGHGTRNDFVLLSDPDDDHPLTGAEVRFLTDRRAGIGADGVLRAVRSRHIPSWRGDPDLWFMDYRNADGSLAEMCGNGVRVFARYLVDEGLVPADTEVLQLGTRAGLRTAELLDDGRVRVWMGTPRVGEEVWVSAGDRRRRVAQAVDVGNPHAVTVLGSGEDVDDLDLTAVAHGPGGAFPGGVNLEFVARLASDHLRMRVVERGVGETQSCGTGTVAAATAVAAAAGRTTGVWRVEVPGGSVEVELGDAEAWLTGPAVLVARGEVDLPGGHDG